MAKITFGTAGFFYKDWFGSFYPKQLEKSQLLRHFSKFFNIVEINSTFYNLPSIEMVTNWYNRVPDKFRFIIKIWQKITHELNENELDNRIQEFFSRLIPLKEKLFGILLQFPPWFKFTEKHLDQLIFLIKNLPSQYKYIIELRDNSWFNTDATLNMIDGKKLILGTTYMPNVKSYYMQNQNYYYIRLIGDRILTEFNRIQRSQKESYENLFKNLRNIIKDQNVYEIFIIVNNHFQGNAPESIKLIKQKLGLSYHNFNNQKNIFDFIQ
ncbi:MAG: DUF72 domain-containing protein [Promethearchaeota archaeon]